MHCYAFSVMRPSLRDFLWCSCIFIAMYVIILVEGCCIEQKFGKRKVEYIKILIIKCSWIANCLVALFSHQIFVLYDIILV